MVWSLGRPAKRDSNHVPLCKLLRKLGWPFRDVSHHHGFGCDIITRRYGHMVFIEFKAPGPPSNRKLTESEKGLLDLVDIAHYFVVQTEDELFAAIGLAVERRHTI